MLIIKDILVSDDVVNVNFLCNLNACKGACCWEGDFGAPLEQEEMSTLTSIYEDIKPFLTPEGIAVLNQKGLYEYTEETEEHGTTLLENGACAYLTYDNGIAKCGIEKAFEAGAISFKKPISCHLYPIRVSKNKNTSFEALNYDRWDICNAACELGKKEQLPVYKFVKEAIIRRYGVEFYDELDAAANHIKQNP